MDFSDMMPRALGIVPTMKRRRGRNALDARKRIRMVAAFLLGPWLATDIPVGRHMPERRCMRPKRAPKSALTPIFCRDG
jgi:hypothetical protein